MLEQIAANCEPLVIAQNGEAKAVMQEFIYRVIDKQVIVYVISDGRPDRVSLLTRRPLGR